MNKFSYFVTFAVGAILGSAVTWHFAKKQCDEIIQREIDSVKEAFHRNLNTDCDKPECVAPVQEELTDDNKQVKKEYKNITRSYNPSYNTSVYSDDIYILSPDEFGENPDHSVQSLTYFSDGVLANDDGDVISIDDTIGYESLEAFGEYEEDAVHVRNHRLKTDFEVLLDSKTYSEVYDGQS